MEVKIITEFGENRFDMEMSEVSSILKFALHCADKREQKPDADAETGVRLEEQAEADEMVEDEPEQAETPDESTYQREEKHTRNDSLFGAGWRDAISADAEQSAYDKYHEDGYKGFLYIKCPSCEKEKGFNARGKMTHYECSCGHRFELENLKPMYAHYDCGKDFKYHTNMDEDRFTYHCMSCNNILKIKLNARGSAFITERKVNQGEPWRL